MRFEDLITVVAIVGSSACSARVDPQRPSDGAPMTDGSSDDGSAGCGQPYTLDPSGRCVCDHDTCGSRDWCCATYPLSGIERWGIISCRPAIAGQTLLDDGVMYCHAAY